MIANIQGYHVSVVTLVLTLFSLLPPPPSKAQPPFCCSTPMPHRQLQSHCSWFTPALHRACTTGSHLNQQCPCRDVGAAGCCDWVPHYVTQAVHPLSDCISTFSRWWTGCSGRNQPSQIHSPATSDRWEVGISGLMSVRTSPSPQDITESQSEKSDAMLQHYGKPNAHPYGWKGCFSSLAHLPASMT